jgi:acyl carrier protein
MLENDKLLDRIVAVLRPHAPEGEDIDARTELVDDLGLDSLKVMKILEDLEDGFDISIPINIVPEVRTVEDLAMEIQQLMDR